MASRRSRSIILWLAFGAILAAGAAWWVAQRRGDVTPGAPAMPTTDSTADSSGPALAGAGTTGRSTKTVAAASDAILATDTTTAADGVGTFGGIAVDAAGKPVAAVTLSVASSTQAKTGPVKPVVTGPDGRFAFDIRSTEKGIGIKGRASGLSLVGSEAYVERGSGARLVFVAAATVRVRVLDDATGVAVEGALVRTVTGIWVNAVWANELEAPFSDEVMTDADGRATLATEGGLVNVLVAPKAHAPAFVPRVNVPSAGRDLDVRVGRGGVVEGHVLDPSGRAVAGAVVYLEVHPLFRRDVTSSADGRFRFEGVAGFESADYKSSRDEPSAAIWATDKGFAFGFSTLEPPKRGATVVIDIGLRRGHRVTGIVETVEHRPAAGITVAVEPAEGDLIYFHPPDTSQMTTGADGRFELTLLPAGPLQVNASAATGSIHAAVMVEVPEEGEPPPVVIVLPDTRGQVTVRVVAPDGKAVAHAKIEVKAGPPVIATVGTGTTDANGVAKIKGLPTDRASVHVIPPASAVMVRALGAAELAGKEVVFRLEGGEVGGRAQLADGSPARARFALESQNGGCIERGESVATDDEGRFHFAHLSEGPFKLYVEGDENVLIDSWGWFPSGELDLKVLIVGTADASRYHLEFVLVEDATGKSIPAAGASAGITPSGSSGWRHHESSSGPASEPGRFVSFAPFPPGLYDVTVTASGWRSARMIGVKLPRDGEPPTLRLDHGVRVGGRLLSSEGAPIEGVKIGIEGQSTTSGADGSYALTGLDIGEQEALVRGDFVVEQKRTITIPASGIERLDWTLTAAGGLSVRFGPSADAGRERVALTPSAGGEAKEEANEPGLSWNEEHEGPNWKGLTAGRYRVAAWQGTKAYPPQEVEVRARETTIVRFPPVGEGAR